VGWVYVGRQQSRLVRPVDPSQSNTVQSRPERAEFVVPVATPPRPVSRVWDVFLPPPALSPYRPADYVSETPESVLSLAEGGLSEEDRLLSDELAELDDNCNAYELSELYEPRKRVSFRVKAFDSSYLEEVVSRNQSENWLDELLEPQDVPMDLPVESPSNGNPSMEPLHTMESPGNRPWDRPFSSAASCLSHVVLGPGTRLPGYPFQYPLPRYLANTRVIFFTKLWTLYYGIYCMFDFNTHLGFLQLTPN